MLHALIPLTHRPNESLPDLVERVSKVRMLRKEMDKTVSQLATERQFNRRVTINATARELKQNLKLLESGE